MGWFARTVVHVRDVGDSIAFYVGRLGFVSSWRHEEEGRVVVAQVEREGVALILSGQWPDKVGNGLVFVSVDAVDAAGQSAALDAFRLELEGRGVRVREGTWGYRVLIVEDPDGNLIYFNYPNEP